MSRDIAIAAIDRHLESGAFRDRLARLVAIPSESQNPERRDVLPAYLESEIAPELTAMGFSARTVRVPEGQAPFLIAERIEDPRALTVLGYAHGDVVRGLEAEWEPGLSPWTLTERNDRWYGRGVVDNKGQHAINFAAMRQVIETRGRLGFNAKWIVEMGEETGSPGLLEVCRAHAAALKADLFIASDGPRLSRDRPTVFLGARGVVSFDLTVDLREGSHHSGNWGGLLANPAILLAHAIACLVGANGQIRVDGFVPEGGIPDDVRAALADCAIEPDPDGPAIDHWWGEPGLTPAEKVYGWSNFEVLAFVAGTPQTPVNAIPPRAWARCQLRHVTGIASTNVLESVRRHLDRHGLGMVQVTTGGAEHLAATRLDLNHPMVAFALGSIEKTTGRRPALLPNLGGGLPNAVFAETLGLPTIWIPHSYPGSSQHAANEHVPRTIVADALRIMTGLYWDLGVGTIPEIAPHPQP